MDVRNRFRLVTTLALLGMATAAFRVPSASAQETAEALRPVAPSIHPELAAHTRHFDRKIYKIADNVYSAVGWHLANTVVVEGTDGLIVIDTGEDFDTAQLVEQEYRKLTQKPVKAVVYTHFHPDHINGVKAWVSAEDVAAGSVQIFAHETLVNNVIRQGRTLGPVLGVRAGYSFGVMLPPADLAEMNGGIGPRPQIGSATFIVPTHTFADRLDVTVAGVQLQMVHVPSEAPDEVAVYLPENRVLCSGEAIQGPTLPNIHTLRGTKFRDPLQWYQSIDVLRAFNAEHLVPAHGQPVSGAAKVEEVLRMTRDGIQYIHDQTVRHMNRGLTPDELVQAVTLPPHLAEYRPYLREYYGTVKHTVRQIYTGYLGWFEGDPVGLDPTPRAQQARRLVALMGGRDRVFTEALAAYDGGDPQWAAELCTYLVRVNAEDADARGLKASALRQLGYASLNINWRNWYLMSAMELEGNLNGAALMAALARTFASPDLISTLPAAVTLQGLTMRLMAEDTLDVHMTMAFHFTDTGDAHALEIRRGVCQFHTVRPDKTDVALELQKTVLDRILLRQTTWPQAIADGAITVTGDPADVGRFFSHFEGPPAGGIALTVR